MLIFSNGRPPRVRPEPANDKKDFSHIVFGVISACVVALSFCAAKITVAAFCERNDNERPAVKYIDDGTDEA